MLDIRNLSVNYGHHPVLRDVSLQVRRKQTVGLVGESGTGKTTLGLSLLGLVEERTDSACVSGRIILGERDLMEMGAEELRRIRWNRISMVFQNSENALNPSMRIVQQVGEPLIAHDLAGTDEARDRAIEMLMEMDFPGNRIEAYPHELSEGEKQRAITAMAFICDPEIVILDEPTASLDAVTSSDLTRTLKDLCDDRVAMIITHDLATAAELADVTAVLYGGSIVEMSPTARFFGSPRHPYSRGLVRSFPDMTRAKDLQGIRGQAEFVRHGCPFHPRCTQSIDLCSREHPDLERCDDGASVACHRGGVVPLLHAEDLTHRFGELTALDHVNLTLHEGETVSVVGMSGAGKTTLGRCLAGIIRPTEGRLYYSGDPVGAPDRAFSRRVQMIFQNPGEALSHRLNVQELVREPLDVQKWKDRAAREEQVIKVLREVELPVVDEFLKKFPHELSGGEAQRVVVARALALEPELLIADEPTSALDPSVQAKVVQLLNRLQEKRGLAMLFITHNLGLARKVSDHIAIMSEGAIVESGPADRVIAAPQTEYTAKLFNAAPALPV